MKKYFYFLVILVCAAGLGYLPVYIESQQSHPLPHHDIVILYDNDVHCATDGYAAMAGLRDSLLTRTPYVTTVSCGDFAQGNVVGSLTDGEYIVDIMNSVPYDITTIGNHEFDYGVDQMLHLSEALTAEVVCCNLTRIADGETLLPSYTIRTYGKTRVAFIGVATPTTFTSSTPTYFQDSVGNVLYDFHRQDTYERVQAVVDEVRGLGVEYVVVLSHLGDDRECAYSSDLIAHTTGIDAVLDGHAHHVFNTTLTDADGKAVVFSSTGTKFANYGLLTITRTGKVQSTLRPAASVNGKAERTLAVTAERMERIREKTEVVIGRAWRELTDHDEEGKRVVRRQETNLSVMLCDAFRTAAGAQIGIMNGGGIRSFIPKGDIDLGEVIAVIPFNNRVWRMRATGQQLLDALEVGVRSWPEEDGDYPHLSGARFEIDASVPSSVTFDENGLFLSVGETRRIKHLEVKNRWGGWSPIDPNATYTIGGQSYIMVSGGSSGAYRYFVPDAGPLMTDVEAVVTFIRSGSATRHYIAPR